MNDVKAVSPKLIISLICTLALMTMLLPVSAVAGTADDGNVLVAQKDDIASGTSGGCSWVIDAEGTLTVAPTDGVRGELESYPDWSLYRKHIKAIVIKDGVGIKASGFDMGVGSIFSSCSAATSIDLSGLDTSNIRDMSMMFWDCSSLISIDISCLDTSKVTDMSGMFSNCESLVSVNLSGIDTSNVTDMSRMFSGCERLRSVDISKLDCSKVMDMSGMFGRCTLLTSVNLSGINTSRATDISTMFWGCESLTSLDISSLDTSNVTSMYSLFLACDSLARVTVGPKFSFKGARVSSQCTLPYGDWISTATGQTLSAQEIADTRNNVSDTYTKVGANVTEEVTPSDGSMHRLYNPNSGEHFYTSSSVERSNLIAAGWQYEGSGWKAPTSGYEVYRLYNSYAGEHHYTLSAIERDALVAAGWSYEGVGWYSDTAQGVPLYRVYNPNEYANNHHYTSSTLERDHLLSLGWQDEGVSWYGISE